MYYFSTGGKFHPNYGLLLELHALTLVARSYALLMLRMYVSCSPFLFFSAVTIGFDSAIYTFNETDSTDSISVVSVQGSNTLNRAVVVTVETADGTATGRDCIYLHYVHMFVTCPQTL